MHTITISAIIDKNVDQVWEAWNNPESIKQWAFASDDWAVGDVENDVREGGRFKTNMHAKDNSASFDFTGTYTKVQEHMLIAYDMDKAPHETRARHVEVIFTDTDDGVKVTETFDPENQNSEEMQRDGWQSILNNFKKFVESK